MRDSTPRHPACEAGALTAELLIVRRVTRVCCLPRSPSPQPRRMRGAVNIECSPGATGVGCGIHDSIERRRVGRQGRLRKQDFIFASGNYVLHLGFPVDIWRAVLCPTSARDGCPAFVESRVGGVAVGTGTHFRGAKGNYVVGSADAFAANEGGGARALNPCREKDARRIYKTNVGRKYEGLEEAASFSGEVGPEDGGGRHADIIVERAAERHEGRSDAEHPERGARDLEWEELPRERGRTFAERKATIWWDLPMRLQRARVAGLEPLILAGKGRASNIQNELGPRSIVGNTPGALGASASESKRRPRLRFGLVSSSMTQMTQMTGGCICYARASGTAGSSSQPV
jgi:hypothetical protein